MTSSVFVLRSLEYNNNELTGKLEYRVGTVDNPLDYLLDPDIVDEYGTPVYLYYQRIVFRSPPIKDWTEAILLAHELAIEGRNQLNLSSLPVTILPPSKHKFLDISVEEAEELLEKCLINLSRKM